MATEYCERNWELRSTAQRTYETKYALTSNACFFTNLVTMTTAIRGKICLLSTALTLNVLFQPWHPHLVLRLDKWLKPKRLYSKHNL
jgi:hypothetical protein